MGWVLRLVEVEGLDRSVDVMAIECPGDLGDIAALGVTLSQGKQLLGLIQQEVVAAQCRELAVRRPECRTCTTPCHHKDYRPHRIAALFGQVTLRLPRFLLRRLGRGRGWARLAGALPLDARTRSGPGAVFRLHAVPGRRRCARTPSADRCRDRLRWLGLSEQNFRLMSGATAGVRLPRSA
jgi:hypothetical protein